MKTRATLGILKEYDEECPLYTKFTKVVENLISDLLTQNKLRVHSITSRIKDRKSLEDKLIKERAKYKSLTDVTDISGIRIITYFADEVDAVASIINREFEIDQENSVDRRALLDPDRFGYLSLHYVAKLSPTRLKLTEYSRFSDCKTEIQIRSILQHTWAEIQHDLGYKNRRAVPREIQRRFSQLAGLLELADDEFRRMRNQILDYESRVPEKIAETPAEVLIDQNSLSAYIQSSGLVKRIDREIASATKTKLEKEYYGDITDIIDRLEYAGFKTIEDIDSGLTQFEKIVVDFAKSILVGEPDEGGFISAGISIFYLCYVQVASSQSLENVQNYMMAAIPDEPKNRIKSFSKILISLYEKSTTTT